MFMWRTFCTSKLSRKCIGKLRKIVKLAFFLFTWLWWDIARSVVWGTFLVVFLTVGWPQTTVVVRYDVVKKMREDWDTLIDMYSVHAPSTGRARQEVTLATVTTLGTGLLVTETLSINAGWKYDSNHFMYRYLSDKATHLEISLFVRIINTPHLKPNWKD